MKTRTLGRTGLEVSELSLGGLFVSKVGGEFEQGRQAIRKAVALGVNYIDTAPGYADSEEVIGRVLPEIEQPLVLSTKLGGRPKPFEPQNRDCLMASIEESLRLLGRDQIDAFHIVLAKRANPVFGQDLDRRFIVCHTEDHACAVCLLCQEGIGIFQIDPVVSKQIQDIDQGARFILKDNGQYRCQGADIAFLFKDLDRSEGIINDHTDNSEVFRLRERQGSEVNLAVLKDFGKLSECAGPVFQKS